MIRAINSTYHSILFPAKVCSACNARIRSGWKTEIVREIKTRVTRYTCSSCSNDSVSELEQLILTPEEFDTLTRYGLYIGEK